MRFAGNGPWELPVRGFEVLHMTFGFLVDIVAYGPEGATAQIRLQGPFELYEPDHARHSLDAAGDPWERLAALFVLRHDTIQHACFTAASDMKVEFSSGHAITSTGDGPYENWELQAPGGILVVGRDGEPAIWNGAPENQLRVRKGDSQALSYPTGRTPPTSS